MAINISTDIAQEVNITSRRNDTFQIEVEVLDSETMNSYDLSANQSASAGALAQNYNSTGFNIDFVPVYQAKMTIKKEGSEFDVLSVYTFMWQDIIFANTLPTLTRAGKYRGEGVEALTSSISAGIFLQSSAGGAGEKISITIPATYMSMSPDTYVYDFQVRKKTTFGSAFSNASVVDLGATYTTWFQGTFTVVNDVTK
jgi:hypothetical protein